MDLSERVWSAARNLALTTPLDRVTISDVARAANVSWPTARRYLGSREKLQAALAGERGVSPEPDTRRRIIEAAARVFSKRGYAETTLDEVAADAGLTKGAVYWHFTSKSDLYLALLETRVRQEAARLPDTIQNATAFSDPEKGLAALLAAQFSIAYADPDRPRLSLEFMSRSWDPQVRERLRTVYFDAQEQLRDMLRCLQDEGLIARDIDPLILGFLFTALIEGLVRLWLIDSEHVDPNGWASTLARILWKGVKP